MIQLFKAKSLKETRNTTQGAGARGAGISTGRSMVEMLGVLAIIGVLSIGGIQGYTIAMRKYRANEIINVVNKYALTIYTSCVNHYEMIQSQIPDTDSGFNYSWNCSPLPFTDSGLGNFPNGLIDIYPNSLATTKRGHVVSFYLKLDSEALCQTILNITGGEHSYSADLDLPEDLAEKWQQAAIDNCKSNEMAFLSIVEN